MKLGVKFSESLNTVYSTEHGRMCPGCSKPVSQCVCKAQKTPQGDGIVRIMLDTKGRGGKSVSVVTGVLVGGEQLKEMCKALKKKCGTGGTVKDGTIEVQGDHREKLASELTRRGYQVKLSGG